MNPLKMIDGYKSYIGIVAGGVLWIVLQLGYVDEGLFKVLGGMIATWTGVSMVHRGNKRATSLRS